MLHWFLRTIHADDDFLGHLDQARLLAQRPAVLWAGLALLVPVGLWIERRQRRNLGGVPAAVRGALCLSRVLVLGLMVAVLSGPYLKLDLRLEKRPIVAVLIDRSQSMDLPAGPFADDARAARLAEAAGFKPTEDGSSPAARDHINKSSRSALARGLAEHAIPDARARLAGTHEIRTYGFARDLDRLGVDPAHPKLPEPPAEGRSTTRLGDAIAGVLDDAAGRPVAAMFLLTDGESLAGRSPGDAARGAAAAGAAIYPIDFASKTRLRDVAIVDLFAPRELAVEDTARVVATVAADGFDGRPVKVELTGDGISDSREIVLRDGAPQPVELTFKATRPGTFAVKVAVAPLPEEDEALKDNNADVATIGVSDEKLKVLLVEGAPRWDFRFVKNFLRRDHGLGGRSGQEPDVLLESELRRQSSGASDLPKWAEALANYHTIVLGDASPELLDSAFLDALNTAVRDKGVGLIVAAGPRSMPQAFDERLLDLLPVRLARRASGMEAPVYKPFRLEPAPDGLDHDALRLYDDAGRSRAVWAQMPPYHWCAAAERPAPGAAVLMWNPSVEGRYGKLPLIAQHAAGAGKVLFLGTDSTWLWRRNIGDRFFDKFWGQAIRAVARQDDAGPKSSTIAAHPARVPPGEPARIELHAYGPDGSPRPEGRLSARVTLPGDSAPGTVELAADPARHGHFVGSFTPREPGDYRITFDQAAGAPAVSTTLCVLPNLDELRHPNVNEAALAQLAGATGGQVIEPHMLAEIAGHLRGEPTYTEVHREASVWDNGLVLGLIVFLYSLDVGLRRLSGLS